MKTCPLRLLAVVILFCTSIPIPAQSQLPEPDPSTMAGQSPEQLLRLSFVGINRANIRAYLAQYHPDTPEGTFSKAWMLDNQRKFPEAVETYTRVVDDSSASPGLRSVAAGNRAASATAGDMPDTNQWIEKSIQAVFELKQLPHGALRNMSTEYRPLWEEMYRQHPQLIAANPAAHLLNEARYYRRAEKGDHPQTRKLIEELLELGPAQWGPDFDVDILLDLLTSPSVFPDMKPEERLTRNDLLPASINSSLPPPTRKATRFDAPKSPPGGSDSPKSSLQPTRVTPAMPVWQANLCSPAAGMAAQSLFTLPAMPSKCCALFGMA